MKKTILAATLFALLPCYAFAAGYDDNAGTASAALQADMRLSSADMPGASDIILELRRWHRDRPYRDWDDDRYEHEDDDYWDDDRYEREDDDYWDDDRYEREDDDYWDDDRYEREDDDHWDDDRYEREDDDWWDDDRYERD